jgi:hypothetical protein
MSVACSRRWRTVERSTYTKYIYSDLVMQYTYLGVDHLACDQQVRVEVEKATYA